MSQPLAMTRQQIYDEFVEWIYRVEDIIWDDRLADLMEDGDMQMRFLEEMGLPDDTEISP